MIKIKQMPPAHRHHRQPHGAMKNLLTAIGAQNFIKNGIAVAGNVVRFVMRLIAIFQISLLKARKGRQRVFLGIAGKAPGTDG
ncbi:hypothetical protein AQ1_00310 [alpha proteobacterium Q-1]|nr:hypothetical protein AQ1_00310 [alpha proteobacterium Q-1]